MDNRGIMSIFANQLMRFVKIDSTIYDTTRTKK